MPLNQEPIQHWKINDLKGVGDVELSLDNSKRVFVFLGSNGVGKTKTLEALCIFLLINTQNLNLVGSFLEEDRLFINASLNNQTLSLVGEDKESMFPNEVLMNRLTNQFILKKHEAIAYLGANQRSSTEKTNSTPQAIGGFKFRQQSYFNMISEAISTDKMSTLGMTQDIHLWFIERAQSVNPYQKNDDNRKVDIDTVLNALHQLDKRIEEKLNVDGDNNVYLTIEGEQFELTELSSGFISIVKIIQSIISAYSAFTNSQNLLKVKGVVLIDEIESHLHVDWQTRIIPTLKSLFPNTTFYIATHSPLVLTQLEEGEAYLLKREDDGVVRSHVIDSPNKRILANVLREAFGIDLNELKRESMVKSDQSLAKHRLLALLDDNETGDASNG